MPTLAAIYAVVVGLIVCVLAVRAPERVSGEFLQQGISFLFGVVLTLVGINSLVAIIFGSN